PDLRLARGERVTLTVRVVESGRESRAGRRESDRAQDVGAHESPREPGSSSIKNRQIASSHRRTWASVAGIRVIEIAVGGGVGAAGAGGSLPREVAGRAELRRDRGRAAERTGFDRRRAPGRDERRSARATSATSRRIALPIVRAAVFQGCSTLFD